MATIRGTYGDDTLSGSASGDYIHGLRSDDVLYGLGGRDTLVGGVGNDTLNGGEDLSMDVLIGGRGDDVYFNVRGDARYGSYLDSVIEERGGGTDTIVDWRWVSLMLPDWVENLTVHTSGVSSLRGNHLDNVITSVTSDSGIAEVYGHRGDDTLIGGAGTEMFIFSGQSGHDFADGGGGARDTLKFTQPSRIHVDFDTGIATRAGDGRWSVTFTNIEEVATGVGNDTLVGGAGNDRLYGGGGNNLVIAGDGDDQLSGGGTLMGEAGNDALYGNSEANVLLGGEGDDWLILYGNDRLDGGPGFDTLKLHAPSNAYYMWGPGKIKEGTLDFTTTLAGKITDIERITIDVDRKYRLVLGEKELLDISSTTHTLIVDAGGGDSIDIVGDYVDEGIHDGYHRYQVGAATLLVDTDVDLVH